MDKRLFAILGVGVALTLGVGVAWAGTGDEDTSSEPAGEPVEPTAPPESGGQPGEETGQEPGDGVDPRECRKRRGEGIGRLAVSAAAETIGIPKEELLAALREGQSIAEVAQANGVDPAAVEGAVVAAATKKLDAAVAAGEVDAERAAMIRERLPELAQRVVNGEHGPGPRGSEGGAAGRRPERCRGDREPPPAADAS